MEENEEIFSKRLETEAKNLKWQSGDSNPNALAPGSLF